MLIVTVVDLGSDSVIAADCGSQTIHIAIVTVPVMTIVSSQYHVVGRDAMCTLSQEQCRRLISHVLSFAIVGMAGCASIMNGTTQSVFVNSTPSGAMVQVDGLQATTPAKLELKRSASSHDIRVAKDGYETAQVSVGRKLNPWLAGNFAWGYGLPLGVLVDFISGGAWSLETDKVDLSLAPKEEATQTGSLKKSVN